MKPLRRSTAAAAIACLLAFAATAPAIEKRAVLLATTTSTQDSGLLDALVPLFETKTGWTVKTVAVGTGQALALGARGEADVVLCHAPDLERNYVSEGAMIERRLVMHNDFVLVGPDADPAGIRGVKRAAEALAKIAAAKATFVSRGDNSGTHLLEQKLWKAAEASPAGAPWYLEAGQGMGATLRVASEKEAYTLSDRGTYLAFKPRIELEVLAEGDPQLLNVYHVMQVNPAKFPTVNAAGGKALADFLTSAEAQAIIGRFGAEKFGQALFVPDAGKIEEALVR